MAPARRMRFTLPACRFADPEAMQVCTSARREAARCRQGARRSTEAPTLEAQRANPHSEPEPALTKSPRAPPPGPTERTQRQKRDRVRFDVPATQRPTYPLLQALRYPHPRLCGRCSVLRGDRRPRRGIRGLRVILRLIRVAMHHGLLKRERADGRRHRVPVQLRCPVAPGGPRQQVGVSRHAVALKRRCRDCRSQACAKRRRRCAQFLPSGCEPHQLVLGGELSWHPSGDIRPVQFGVGPLRSILPDVR